MSVLARVVLLWLAAIAVLPGCGSTRDTAAGTPARFNKMSGNLTTSLATTLGKAYAAAQSAVDELEFRTLDKRKDAIKATLTARTAHGDKVVITIERQSDAVSEVTVDVGSLGKEDLARLVLDKMEARAR